MGNGEARFSPGRRGPAAWLTALGTITIIAVASLACFVPFYLLALIRALVSVRRVRRWCIRALLGIARFWGFVVRDTLRLLLPTRFEISGLGRLDRHGSYLVIANHQSWVDIFVLFVTLHGRVPFFRFFMKRELVWLPFFGLTLWALDFPAMHRFSRSHLERHPEDRGRDLEITRRACEKFRRVPVTLVNFLEGTRFSPGKRDREGSSYQHLLRPKSGGLALVLAVMGQQLSSILDVTVVYPNGGANFWRFVSGQVPWVVAQVDSIPPPPELVGRADVEEPGYREALREWLHRRWEAKDATIATVRAEREAR